MIVLVPVLSGKESDKAFIDTVASSASKIILLNIVDKSFMNRTSSAMGEVRQLSNVAAEARKKIGAKKKPCEEATEWGETAKKIISFALFHKVDKVCLVKQSNKFFDEVLSALQDEKLNVELIEVAEPVVEDNEKGKAGKALNLLDNIFGRRLKK